MCISPDDLKAFALVHDPERGVLYEIDAAPTGSTVRMTNLAARVDDPAGVTRMAVKDATSRLELVREGRNVADFASIEEWGTVG